VDHTRPVTIGGSKKHPLENFALLEKCLGQSLKLLDIVKKSGPSQETLRPLVSQAGYGPGSNPFLSKFICFQICRSDEIGCSSNCGSLADMFQGHNVLLDDKPNRTPFNGRECLWRVHGKPGKRLLLGFGSSQYTKKSKFTVRGRRSSFSAMFLVKGSIKLGFLSGHDR